MEKDEQDLISRKQIDANDINFVDMNPEHYRALRLELAKTSDILNSAKLAMEKANLSYLSRLIFRHEEWLPNDIVLGFRNALLDLSREGKYPYFDRGPIEFDSAKKIHDTEDMP